MLRDGKHRATFIENRAWLHRALNSVPSDGAINVESCKFSSAAPVAPAPVRGWLLPGRYPVRVTGTVLTQFILCRFQRCLRRSREERAFSRSFAEMVRLFHVLAGGCRSSAHSHRQLAPVSRCGGLSDFFIAIPGKHQVIRACATETPAFACIRAISYGLDPVRPAPGPL